MLAPMRHRRQDLRPAPQLTTQAIQPFEETYVASTRENDVPPQFSQGGNL
jgi:hypothetical protein